MISRFWRYFIQPLDGFLMLMLFCLAVVGLTTLYSAGGQSLARVEGQLINWAVALTAMWIIAKQPPQRLMSFAVPLYAIGVLLLVAVFLFGESSKGAQRWLHLGVVRIQPSELMKIVLPMMLAWYLHKHEAMLRLRDFAIAGVLLLLPIAFVLKQPDLGTAILIGGAGFFVLFLAGLSWRFIVVMVCIGISGIWFVSDAARCVQLFKPYQCQRVQTQIDPTQDPLGKGYHTIQGMIAIGSGGVGGKGWLHGTQTHLDYIPEPATDFIFAVYSEEFGFVGNMVLLVLYLLLLGRGLIIALKASTTFGRLLAGAITMTIFTYAMVNMGMVSGVLPVVGVPLPFMSYGGTSLVTLLSGIGMLMSIHKHKALIKFG